jgi:hypothetical protein
MQPIAQIGLTMRYTMKIKQVETGWLEQFETVLEKTQVEPEFDKDITRLIEDIAWTTYTARLGSSTITGNGRPYMKLRKKGN